LVWDRVLGLFSSRSQPFTHDDGLGVLENIVPSGETGYVSRGTALSSGQPGGPAVLSNGAVVIGRPLLPGVVARLFHRFQQGNVLVRRLGKIAGAQAMREKLRGI
jgi:hypothetical protein